MSVSFSKSKTENITISYSQIKELYTFTRAHFVEHYDVQTELVDHLANGIEAQWAAHSKRTFKEALNIEFKKFGVFGFQDVVGEKHKAMSKTYRKILWGYFKEWWSLPKLMLTLSMIAVFFYSFQVLPTTAHKKWVFLAFFLIMMTFMLQRSYVYQKRMKKLPKKWLLQELIFNQGAMAQFVFLPIHFLNTWSDESLLFNSIYGLLLISLFIVATIILVVVTCYVIPSRAEEHLKKTYLEYQMG